MNFKTKLQRHIRDSGSKMQAKKMSIIWYKEIKNGKSKQLVYKLPAQKRMQMGKIYTFNYKPVNKSTLSYYDKQPLVLSLGQSKEIPGLDLGVNLNFLPQKFKLNFINTIYNHNLNLIEKSNRNKTRILTKGKSYDVSMEKPLRCNYKLVKRLLPKELSFALRSYYVGNRSNTLQFSYENWTDISFLEIQDFESITVKQLYKMWQNS